MKADSFQLGALSSSKRFCCTWWEGTWLCSILLVSPKFALITVFLQSLGSLYIFAILGSILIVGGSRKGMLPAFCRWLARSIQVLVRLMRTQSREKMGYGVRFAAPPTTLLS